MKSLIALTLLLTAGMSFASSDTDCWTDLNGNIHCSTTSYPDGDITPHGAY